MNQHECKYGCKRKLCIIRKNFESNCEYECTISRRGIKNAYYLPINIQNKAFPIILESINAIENGKIICIELQSLQDLIQVIDERKNISSIDNYSLLDYNMRLVVRDSGVFNECLEYLNSDKGEFGRIFIKVLH